MVANNYKIKLAERLRLALKDSRLSKKDIERKTGVSYTAVQKWFKNGSIKDDNLRELAELLTVDYLWLVAGEDSVQVREFNNENKSERDVMIAVYNVSLSAGNGMTAPEYIETSKHLPFDSQWLNKHGLKAKNLMVLRVAGDSMLPTMEDNDSVLIDKSKTKIIDRKIYGIVLGGECKIKRLSQKFDGTVEVLSDNPLHSNESITPDDLEHLHIIGQAVYRSGML